MPAPLLPLAMMSMMPGMMPGMGLAMGAGGMAGGAMGGGLMGGIGKGIGNILGGGGIFGGGGQKPKNVKFDKVTIGSVEIKEVSIKNLTIDSTDKAEEDDFDKAEENKGKVVDKTLTSDLEQTESLSEKGFIGGMENSIGTPIEGLSDSNTQLNEILSGKSSLGGGFPELTDDTGDMTGSLDTIADNTKILEELFNWNDAEKDGEGDRGWIDQIFDGILKPFSMAWGAIIDIAKGWWEVVTTLYEAAWTAITTVAEAAWTVITTSAEAAWTVITTAAEAAWTAVTDTWELSLKTVELFSSEAREWFDTAVQSFLSAVETFSSEAREWAITISDIGIDIGQAVGNEIRETFDTVVDSFLKVTDQLGEFAIGVSDEAEDWVRVAGEGMGVLDAKDTNITVMVPLAKDLKGDVMAIRDTLYDIKDVLTGCCAMKSQSQNLGLESQEVTVISENDESQEVTVISENDESQEVILIPPQDMELIPKNEDHDELQAAISENVAAKAISDSKPGDSNADIVTTQPKKNASQRPQDRDISTRAEKSSGSRGMIPSYTKAAPPPRGMSNRTIDEVQSYLKFPKWRTRMG